MTSKTLTYEEALLLQRYLDGEAQEGEVEKAEELVSTSAAARIYLEALRELGEGVRAAAKEAWRRAPRVRGEEILERALSWAGWASAPLEELAPMLERFHDGEVDGAEGAVIAGLLEEREDVGEYLAELEGLSRSIRELSAPKEEIDFGGLWAGIAEAIGEEEATLVGLDPFDLEEEGLLVQRFHDGEVSADEARRVQNWIDGNEPLVEGMLGALAELHVGVNAGVELAQERAELDQIWAGIEGRLDEIDAEKQAGNVVALGPRREAREARRPGGTTYLALAAMVLVVIFAGLFLQQVQGPERIVETRTVVIFDSVEYAPGSSVMIHTPELASHGGGLEEDLPILWVIEEDQFEDDYEDEEDGSLPVDERFHGPF